MPKLEEMLKAQGFTDEEIAANATVLADPKLRGALETSYGKLESTLSEFKTENDKWATWHKESGEVLSLYEKERNDARVDLAAARERLKMAEEAGFVPTSSHKDPAKDPAKPAGDPAPFDPKAHKLVTQDDIAKYADLEGQAIAMAQDIAEEYRHLTGGKSIFEYSAEFDGRTVRGMQALRTEALKSNKRLDQYVAEKFDFAGKRSAIEAKRREDERASIAAEERGKLIKEFGDPNLRPMMPSRDPFVPRPASAEAKQPWEQDMTAAQRRANRLERAMQTQMKGAVQ